MSVSGWEPLSVIESSAIHVGCMEILKKLSSRVMALSQSRHSSRIRLSPREMLAISEQVSRDFTPLYCSRLSAKKSQLRLSAREMRSVSDEISREFAVRPTPQLPHSEIVLLPVDPDHLHAYWHFDEKQLEEKPVPPLTLRIYSMPDSRTEAGVKPEWFDRPIESGSAQYKITVPATMTSHYYSATIGWQADDYHFVPIASSETAFIPRTQSALTATPTKARQRQRVLQMNASGRGKDGK